MDRNFLNFFNEFDTMLDRVIKPQNFQSKLVDNKRIIDTYDNTPLTNILENDEFFKYEIITPGVTKENITIELEDNLIKFSGLINTELNDGEKYNKKEYYITKFYRVFNIPENIITNEINAKTENGITTIFLPKEKPKKNKNSKRIIKIQ